MKELEPVPQDIKDAVQDIQSDWFNYSRPLNPLYSFPGAVLLTRKNDFNGWHHGVLPKPIAVSAQTFAVLYAFTHATADDGHQPCSPMARARPAEPPVQEYLHMEPFPDRTYMSYCFAVANVTFEAGVVHCKGSGEIVAKSLAECRDQKLNNLEPDPLVEFSLALVPETIMQVVSMNNTGWDFKSDSENYVKNILNLSFQGIWSAMTYFLNGGQKRLPSVAYERI